MPPVALIDFLLCCSLAGFAGAGAGLFMGASARSPKPTSEPQPATTDAFADGHSIGYQLGYAEGQADAWRQIAKTHARGGEDFAATEPSAGKPQDALAEG